MKRLVKILSVAAVLTTTAFASANSGGPLCTIYTFLDQGAFYFINLPKSEIFKAIKELEDGVESSGFPNDVEENALKLNAIINSGIREGATQRIKDDLGLNNMTLELRDKNG